MENMINARLCDVIDEQKKLLSYAIWLPQTTVAQSTFYKNYANIYIYNGFANNRNITVISLDLEKAFDRLCRHKIFLTLEHWNLKRNMAYFITQFSSDRKFQVRIQDILPPIYSQENGAHRKDRL